MFTSSIFQTFTFSILIMMFLLHINYSISMNLESINCSFVDAFSPAVATWYGDPTGAGSTGGACGFGNDVTNPPYNGMVSAGNNAIYESGKGCGSCYRVKCTENPSCSGNPITITIIDECPGCNNDAVHFDLSGKAIGSLAKAGQAGALQAAGRINIQYQRVQCSYGTGITFKIDPGSNPNYLAFAIEFVSGDGDIGSVQLSSSNSKGWLSMQESWGATWKVDLPNGINGPYTVQLTTIESKKTFLATNVIPANWAPGSYYHSGVTIQN